MGGAGAAILAVALLSAGVAAATTPPPSLNFDTVFATKGEPRQLHVQVLYQTPTGIHRLAISRDGDRRVKRVTDGVVTTLAQHRPGDANFSMQVVDPHKHTTTHVDRTSLYRIGNFTDWFDLTHGLRHPLIAYQLRARAPLSPMPRVPAPCRWYDLTEQGRTVSICWDPANRLPLLIATGPSHPVWRVLSLDRGPLPPGTWELHDQSFVHDDAVRDVSND